MHALPGITEINTFESWLNYVLRNFKRIHQHYS